MNDGATQGRIHGFDPGRLRTLRETKQWTQNRLAAEAGIVFKTLTAWESNARTPSPENLVKLAEALEVDPGDLLDIPRNKWNLMLLRQVSGLQQWKAAEQTGISPERMRHIEDGTNALTLDVATSLAKLYRTTPVEVEACWARTREQLTTTKEGTK